VRIGEEEKRALLGMPKSISEVLLFQRKWKACTKYPFFWDNPMEL